MSDSHGRIEKEKIDFVLATDCGSTTTKAILIERKGGSFRLVTRGGAPTTVEEPFADVTVGVINAVSEVEELSGRSLLAGGGIMRSSGEGAGTDIYVSTSSAGGGLQMMCAGVVRSMTAESAERAALGAGAIVMDTIATNDGRLTHQQIEIIRDLRPDMILLSGGVDGGTTTHVAQLADVIHAASPRPRLGIGYKLPIVYAGNRTARDIVSQSLGEMTDLYVEENIRPTLEVENLYPAREKIHELFMEHVMAQAPGYRKLMGWTDAPIMPTPGAVGDIMKMIADLEKINLLGVDIGGATTDIFSVFGGVFNRTVSANLGMSYSISNVVTLSGPGNIMRWLPFEVQEEDLRNRVKNKMIRPTTIPQLPGELIMEQGIAREALRLALEQHKTFATELKGVQRQRTISDTFDQKMSDTLVKMMDLDLLVGSGGVLSHAPRRSQAAMMLIDGFLPEGFTRLAVDSIFMMPQLGVLSHILPQAAVDVFHRDCLIHLGTCIAPVGAYKRGKPAATLEISFPGGHDESVELRWGELLLKELGVDETAEMTVTPVRGVDLGEGPGKKVVRTVKGGVVGLILDGRGRPLQVPAGPGECRAILKDWYSSMDLYRES